MANKGNKRLMETVKEMVQAAVAVFDAAIAATIGIILAIFLPHPEPIRHEKPMTYNEYEADVSRKINEGGKQWVSMVLVYHWRKWRRWRKPV